MRITVTPSQTKLESTSVRLHFTLSHTHAHIYIYKVVCKKLNKEMKFAYDTVILSSRLLLRGWSRGQKRPLSLPFQISHPLLSLKQKHPNWAMDNVSSFQCCIIIPVHTLLPRYRDSAPLLSTFAFPLSPLSLHGFPLFLLPVIFSEILNFAPFYTVECHKGVTNIYKSSFHSHPYILKILKRTL